MLLNYLKIAWRNMSRNKAFTTINIIGLALGLACFIVIALFINDELSFDKYNEKADQIVRVVFKGSVKGEQMKEANVMPPVAQTLKADYPEVLEATRLRSYGKQRIAIGEKSFKEDELAYVDPNFFDVFTLPFISGDSKTALLQPNTIVISEAVATKYFANQDPVGKSLVFKGLNANYTITGVIKNIPANSHFHFDILAAMATLPEAKEQSWMTSNFYTYLVLPKGYDYKKLEAKLPSAIDKYLSPQLQQSMGMTMADFRKAGNNLGLYLQPLTDIHLRSDVLFDLSTGGNLQTVYIFAAIAIFMLLIACINFMNLSTAGASKRAREVGIRKVLGSRKHQLVWQFLIDSIVLTFISLALALLLVKLALPVFNTLSQKHLEFTLLNNPLTIGMLVVFGIVVGSLAGSYPAFFLSSFNTIAVLKSKFSSGKQSIGIRGGLVVFQFFVSITLIVCTIVVYNQLHYINNKDVGYDKEEVLLIGETYLLGKNEALLHNQLKNDTRVVNISTSSFLPAGPSNSNNFIVYPDYSETQLVKTLRYHVDPQYIPTMGMKLVAGRNFSENLASDSNAIILNEASAKAFGWKNEALGHKITYSMNGGQKQS
ncbi:MAG: ABC transporter permease, partial [Aquabacterium sp.]|nr:ABC transporter permease [Ferruginibacter sp.]